MARPAKRDVASGERFKTHLRKPDHWTFLLALVLVLANVVVGSRRVSAVAAGLLSAALVYDAYEFVEGEQ